MKKIFNVMMVLGLAAMTFCACEKKDPVTPEDPKLEVSECLKSLSGIQLALYESYSEPGKIDYMINLYDSVSEDNLPMVVFDIYTKKKNDFAGEWKTEDGTMDLEYGYVAYMENAKDEDPAVVELAGCKGAVKITVVGDSMRVYGSVTDAKSVEYVFDVKAPYFAFDAEHYGEPEDASNYTLDLTEGTLDASYADYGIVYLDAQSKTSYLSLEFYGDELGLDGNLQDGTYDIKVGGEEDLNYFEAGYFDEVYTLSPAGSIVAVVDGGKEQLYYLASGKVTISGNGTKCAVEAKSAHGTTIKAEFDYTVDSLVDEIPFGAPRRGDKGMHKHAEGRKAHVAKVMK